MVVITVKMPAVQGKPAIRECRSYPNTDFDQEVPDFMELDDWAEELLAKAGYDTSNFQLLLEGKALTNANTTPRLSAMADGVVMVTIHFGHAPTSPATVQLRLVGKDAAGSAAGAAPAGGAPGAEGVLTSSPRANKESPVMQCASEAAGTTHEGTDQDHGNAAICCALLRECVTMRVMLEGSVQMITQQGNALIALAQWALQEWTEVTEAVSQLTESGHGEVAQGLLRRARNTYDGGLSHCGLFRVNSQNVARKLKAFCQAVEASDHAAANRHILSAADLSSELASQCEDMQTKIEGLLQELRDEVRKCREACGAARSSRNSNGFFAATLGIGSCSAAAGFHASGGLTAAVSSGLLGLSSVSIWNPAGLACCGVAVGLAGAVAKAGWDAARHNSAERESHEQMETAEQVRKMTDEVGMATEVCCNMWKSMATIGQNIQSSLDHDVQHLGDTDHNALRNDIDAALKQLEHLLYLQDECLVWMTEEAVYQLPFDVRTEIGQDRYEALKALRKAGEAAQPQGNRFG